MIVWFVCQWFVYCQLSPRGEVNFRIHLRVSRGEPQATRGLFRLQQVVRRERDWWTVWDESGGPWGTWATELRSHILFAPVFPLL